MSGTSRNDARRFVLWGKVDSNPIPAADGFFQQIRVNENGDILTAASETTYTTRLDEPSAGITYVGQAVVGALEASAVWQIKKITESGSTTKIEFADGNQAFDNVWNNRASLTYS